MKTRDEEKTKAQLISELSKLRERIALLENAEGNLVAELQNALSENKVLIGMIPVCAWCRKIRDDNGFWHNLELYIEKHSRAKFTHGICPECEQKENHRLARAETVESNPL